MLKIIVNADDFGLTDGCNKGILKAIKQGIVTNTTVMINMPFAEEGIKMAKSMGIDEMGIHLTLTCGTPVSPAEKVLSLLADTENFHKRTNVLREKMDLKQVEVELQAQISKFKSTGMKLTHIDSHHHAHMYPGIAEIVVKLAKEENVPLRNANNLTNKLIRENDIQTTEHFTMDFYDKNVSVEKIKEIIKRYNKGTLEIMCHPSMVDADLIKVSSYHHQREKELEVLTSVELRNWLKEEGIELTCFEDLRDGKVN